MTATATDWGGLVTAEVGGVARPTSEAQLREIVVGSRHLTLRGSGHSSGGQSFAGGAVLVDMRGMDRVLELDAGQRTIRLQAGATWAAVTQLAEPHRLGPATKQEFDCFTIGGSLAANAHGKSIDHGPLISSVKSVRMLMSDGKLVCASRTENPDLFRAAVGGYGLLGVIVDATLQLVDDRPVTNSERVLLDRGPLLDRYLARVADRDQTPLCYGFMDRDFRRGCYVAYTYDDAAADLGLGELQRHGPPQGAFNAFVGLQRRSAFVRGQALRAVWAATRHQERTLRSRRLLLWDEAPSGLQGTLLQKYIVDVDRFAAFVDSAAAIVRRHGAALPLLSPHFRFIPGGDEALLPLAPRDGVCLILSHLTRPGHARWRSTFAQATAELLEACLVQGGRHYLTFDTVATREQLLRAYPRWDQFVALKQQLDPAGRFTSAFYQRYEEAA